MKLFNKQGKNRKRNPQPRVGLIDSCTIKRYSGQEHPVTFATQEQALKFLAAVLVEAYLSQKKL